MSKKKLEFIGNNSQEIYFIEERLAQGGQGTVYLVKAKSNGKNYAVKWYHNNSANEAQRRQLEDLVTNRSPNCDVEGIEFIWPIELVHFKGSNSFGYVMPLYDSERYVHYNQVINNKVKQPTRNILARLSYLVCMGIEAIHRSGLAYCDINLGNINFDIKQGSIVICDNDNVVVNNTESGIAGVPEFMAPEVALGKSKPNAQSDLYSLAILLYQMWMWEHPMEGKRTAKVRSWDQPAKLKYYAKEPLFAHHPTDKSNSASGDPILAYSVRRWNEICPSSLKELFIRAFTKGVHNPSQRPRLSEWTQCFLEMEANASKCPNCSAINLLEPDYPGQPCYYCKTPQPVQLILKINYPGGDSSLIVHDNAPLRNHHMNVHAAEQKALDIVGRIENHPKQPGAHILRNLTKENWMYEVNGQRYNIEPNRARPLIPGGKIYIGNAKVEVVTMKKRN